jgi:hypothetical protein
VKAAWAREPQLIWSFWVAATIVAVGGAIPFLIGGSSSRIASVFIPVAIAALAFAACALVHEQGRAITSTIYLLAGLAIVYGLLTMFALPLQLAVLGTCPIPPQPCASGLQHSLTVSENTGIGFAATFGIVALFVGFFGLVVVYRRAAAAAHPAAPPVRTIPPVAPRPVKPAAVEAPKADDGAMPTEPKADVKEPKADVKEPKADVKEPKADVKEPKADVKEPKELPAPEPELELPAHEEAERPELPPHESTSPTT